MIPTIHAYLDPGTGSMLAQLLAGGLAAAGVALKLYWGRVLRFLRIRRDPKPDEKGQASYRATTPAPESQSERSREYERDGA